MNQTDNNLRVVFNIQEGEGRLVLWLLLNSFLNGLGRIYFETASYSLFLSEYGAEFLPYVYIGGALIVSLVGFFYTRIQARCRLRTLLTVNLGFSFGVLFLFQILLFFVRGPWPFMAMMVFLPVVSVLTPLAFSGLAGQLLDVRQAKRLFSLIACGSPLAHFVGGYLVPYIVSWVGTRYLVTFSTLGLFSSWLVVLHILRRFYDPNENTVVEVTSREPPELNKRPGFFSHPFVLHIFFLAVIGMFGFYFVDRIFMEMARSRFPHPDDLAGFLGRFLGIIGILNLCFRSLISGRILNRFGITVGLLALPVGLAVTLLPSVFFSLLGLSAGLVFVFMAATKLISKVFLGSLNHPSFQILYQTLSPSLRTLTAIRTESIVAPLATGMAGALLILLQNIFKMNTLHLALTTFLILGVWAAIALKVRSEYSEMLFRAVARRSWRAATLSFKDATTIKILEHSLRSRFADEVLYSLNSLEGAGYSKFPEVLITLLKHESADVRLQILKRIAAMKYQAAKRAVWDLVENEREPVVRGEALKTVAVLCRDGELEPIHRFIDHGAPAVQTGALVGLLRQGGIESILAAGQYLLEATRSDSVARRVLAAQVVGEVGISHWTKPLRSLLEDEDVRVRRAALESAGKLRNEVLLPMILRELENPATRFIAGRALVVFGEPAREPLRRLIADCTDTGQSVWLIRVFGRLDRGRSGYLNRWLSDDRVEIRNGAVTALYLARYRAKGEEVRVFWIRIREEITKAVGLLNAVAAYEKNLCFPLVREAKLAEVERIRRRVFNLLAMIFPFDAVKHAQSNLCSPDSKRKALALEFFDNLIDNAEKPFVLPFIAPHRLSENPPELKRLYPSASEESAYWISKTIIGAGSAAGSWVRMCALYETLLEVGDWVSPALKASEAPQAEVRETAYWVLCRLDPEHRSEYLKKMLGDDSALVKRTARRLADEKKGTQAMGLLIEKVLILKTVSIFSRVNDEVLTALASRLVELDFEADQQIVEKGEIQTSLYLIINGSVKVHDGDHTLVELGSREIFGEMAALDPAPRSASVTAIEPTRTYLLQRDDLIELMADHVEVAIGIIEVLTRRLRQKIVDHNGATTGHRVSDIAQALRQNEKRPASDQQ